MASPYVGLNQKYYDRSRLEIVHHEENTLVGPPYSGGSERLLHALSMQPTQGVNP